MIYNFYLIIIGCIAGVATMNYYVYAVGGYDGSQQLSSVERYDTIMDKWEMVASMNCPRSALSVAVIDSKLYALGIFIQLIKYLTCIEKQKLRQVFL